MRSTFFFFVRSRFLNQPSATADGESPPSSLQDNAKRVQPSNSAFFFCLPQWAPQIAWGMCSEQGRARSGNELGKDGKYTWMVFEGLSASLQPHTQTLKLNGNAKGGPEFRLRVEIVKIKGFFPFVFHDDGRKEQQRVGQFATQNSCLRNSWKNKKTKRVYVCMLSALFFFKITACTRFSHAEFPAAEWLYRLVTQGCCCVSLLRNTEEKCSRPPSLLPRGALTSSQVETSRSFCRSPLFPHCCHGDTPPPHPHPNCFSQTACCRQRCEGKPFKMQKTQNEAKLS